MQNAELRQRLLAILAADAFGYSRMMAVDERATVAALDAARDVFRAQIAAGGGRLVDTAGDSVLAVFDTATGAVNAALAVQAQLAQARAEAGPDAPALHFRIGIQLGDVFEKADGSVYGDGVNVAARLQAIAEVDGLTVSQSVQAAVQGRVAARFEDIGRQAVKNIAQPVLAYRVHPGAAQASPRPRSMPGLRAVLLGLGVVVVAAGGGLWWHERPAGPVSGGRAGAAVERKSIAVLPFANVGGDPANEFLTDGITDELIGLLSRVRGLRVTGRDSSFYFKGRQVPMPETARQLGVSYLVGGSVRREGARVRIGAQLLDAASGAVLWSRSYDRELREVLAAQTEIALGIAGSLTQSLDSGASLGGRSTTVPEAWVAFLEAQRLPPDQRMSAYQRVLALDPNFARVHAAMAEEQLGMAGRGQLTLRQASERMVVHLEDALRIDPRYDHAYGLLGASARIVDDVDALRRHAQRALAMDPDSAAGHAWMAELKLADGDIGGALPSFRLAAEGLPLVDWMRHRYGSILRLAHQPALALQVSEQVLALDPDYRPALDEKARTLWMLGRRDEALSLARARDLGEVLSRYGTPDDQAALRRRKDLGAHAAAWLAFAQGRPEAVVDHLEAEHSADIQSRGRVLFDPEYDPVRALPSFQAWLARHKLTEAHERAQAWRAANPLHRP